MFDCHKDMLGYHDDKVTLPEAERAEMRERRDANRSRLRRGLKRDGEPQPTQSRSQGSYEMRTMVQQSEKDYDIDDGVYFAKDDLKDANGGNRTAADAKEMVRKAVHDDKFKKAPEVRESCIRIYYDAGYRVDLPVYRTTLDGEEQRHELAGSDWRAADPSKVTEWFLGENDRQSPDQENGGQLRRITRLLKGFARSRATWRDRIATGFMITKLVTERYSANQGREDQALYDTMVGIRSRLDFRLEIDHPTMPGEKLTKGADDERPRFFRNKLAWAIEELEVLFSSDCTRKKALQAWGRVFNTSYFVDRLDGDETEASSVVGDRFATGQTAAILRGERSIEIPSRPVEKRGGGRYA